jgi:flavodoxin
MNILITYDSFFGNTEKVAKEIQKVLQSKNTVKLLKVSEVDSTDLKDIDMLIVGSPTRIFKYSPNIKTFLNNIPKDSLKDIKVISFDTRMKVKDTDPKFLSKLVKRFGYAMEKIQKKLISKGGIYTIEPKGFYVKDTEGPLEKGELGNIRDWLSTIPS